MANESYDRYIPQPKEEYPQIYAYRVKDNSGHVSEEIKVGYTTKKDVRDRIIEQLQTSNQDYVLEYHGDAIRIDGSTFTDSAVHRLLALHGAVRVPRKDSLTNNGKHGKPPEIFRNCTAEEVKSAVDTLRTGEDRFERNNDYKPRKEQEEAIERTMAWFEKERTADPSKPPKFLWNAKMRFGKTFTALELAVRMHMKRVLVISFKVEVKDSWRNELLGHVDFKDWQWVDVKEKDAGKTVDMGKSMLAFGSFQDLLGKNEVGGIKAKNEWVHTMNWDMIIFDEYHFGSWRDRAQDLIDKSDDDEMALLDNNILPITADYLLYMSGTPFRALHEGEFEEYNIYNWTYSDEQQAKADWKGDPKKNPYASMPEMILMTYQLPEVCTQIALKGEQDEFDLNEFFRAECPKILNKNGKEVDDIENAHFVHANEVQRWLDIIYGKADISTELDKSMGATKPVLPYYDVNLRQYVAHSVWYMHSVASCYAMRNLLMEKGNSAFYGAYKVIVAAGNEAGSGAKALEPVREAMGNPLETKTITITCGKLTTGVTVKPWSAIFMLTAIRTPESYFQSAFRVQSAWTIKNDDISEPDIIMKPKCYIFDFAPNRALRQLSEYACGLNPDPGVSAEEKVADFTKFLPVLAFDGTSMSPVNATEILDYVASGTTATLLARKWDSALLVNVDNDTLQKIIDNQQAMDAIMNIEGFRAMGSDVFETIINKSKALKDKRSTESTDKDENKKTKKEATEEEKKLQKTRKQVQENLRKFATRIPLFMYLTDEREVTLMDVITKVEPGLFKRVTGISVTDFNTLVSLNVFNSAAMNEAVAAFRRYEESSLGYTGLNKHDGEKVGLWDITIRHEDLESVANG
jgi:hypothetical protein